MSKLRELKADMEGAETNLVQTTAAAVYELLLEREQEGRSLRITSEELKQDYDAFQDAIRKIKEMVAKGQTHEM